MAVTTADVRGWLVSSTGAELPTPSDEDEAILERVIAAVYNHVERTHIEPVPPTDDYEHAIVMMSARLWQRRYSVNGIGSVNDFGPLRVTSIDPDVAMLLGPFRRIVFS